MSVYTPYDDIYLMIKSRKDFVNHKHNAKSRKILFLLSFDEWIKIWTESGHLLDRGCRSGSYVMARFNDIGPYSINNVAIISQEENLSQSAKRQKGKPKSKPKLKELRKQIQDSFSLSKDRNF